MRRPLFVVLLALLLTGCGLGAGETPTDVTLRVTDGFGRRTILQSATPKIEGEDTIMRLLRRNARVDTAYGGAFVTAVSGREGGERADGRTRDWIYFVNGVQAEKGATSIRVHDGDHIWWDRQETGLAAVGAVVGSFPAPLRGDGARPDLACADPAGEACRTTVDRLRAAGVATQPRALDDRSPSATVRVLVGAWPALRREDGARAFARGPRASGVLAVPVRGGLAAYDAAGRSGPLLRRWGLVAAMRPRGSGVTWLVTGATEADATAAAAALREPTLRGRFAVLVRGDRTSPLPTGPER
ncbi:DUF4430 domain-containing protein [Patulibacter minatonensis]|uniref:DUF4430 domain-containing protein n=1 Tax=Patulibacter minatonensis TaxID=298163 RepID=UPI00047B66CA|nr:DUF4430 domain-containing protein [Patulibacter minatonensis]